MRTVTIEEHVLNPAVARASAATAHRVHATDVRELVFPAADPPCAGLPTT